MDFLRDSDESTNNSELDEDFDSDDFVRDPDKKFCKNCSIGKLFTFQILNNFLFLHYSFLRILSASSSRNSLEVLALPNVVSSYTSCVFSFFVTYYISLKLIFLKSHCGTRTTTCKR
ncbi:uncharacterized protein LOC129616451 isoform X1 [Condylostylus longicornis]|uniref:uncharacterized protein LOC129616451 isoform X1 n=1 Tax=Condylostylus longicornis TaxID=2530218 RepID=UPI00244DB6EE|nr:uncharacterized protein LOC129616451 isoform X1 [Condylostylus longicornis]